MIDGSNDGHTVGSQVNVEHNPVSLKYSDMYQMYAVLLLDYYNRTLSHDKSHIFSLIATLNAENSNLMVYLSYKLRH